MRRPLRRRTAVLLATLLLAACTADTPAAPDAPLDVPAAPDPGTAVPDTPAAVVRVGLARDPATLDPRRLADDEGALVVQALFDGLVDVGPDGGIVDAAAADWTVEDDGRTYRFLLREDRFHDGTPVRAADHAAALLATLDPQRAPLFRQDLLTTIRGARLVDDDGTVRWGLPADVLAAGGVEVVGPRELVLRLTRPDPLLLYRLADPALSPLPPLATDDPQAFALRPVGNGPFRMAGPREPGAFIRLAAWEAHPRPARIDELVLQVYEDDVDGSARWDDLLAERLRITGVPAQRREEARRRFGTPLDGRRGPGLHTLPSAALYAYGMAVDVPPYDDVRLRRAISAAIDRDAVAELVATAGAVPATGIVPPHLGGDVPDCDHCRHDPDLARALIDDWRADRPGDAAEPPLTLTYPRGAGHVGIAERVADDLEATLGLDVRLQARDFATLVRAVETREAPLFRLGLRAVHGGAAAGVTMLDPALRPGAAENWTGWSEVEVGTLLDGWDPARPDATVRAVERRALDAAALVPILWTPADLVVHPAIGGFHLDPTGRWWPELVYLR